MPSFTRESGGTLHVAVMGVNRIGKEFSTGPFQWPDRGEEWGNWRVCGARSPRLGSLKGGVVRSNVRVAEKAFSGAEH